MAIWCDSNMITAIKEKLVSSCINPGRLPWQKKNRKSELRPQKLAALRNSRVWLSVALLVMMASGTLCPNRFLTARSCPRRTSNRVSFETVVIGKVPFGPSKPKRVPCPPAIKIAPTCPAARASCPCFKAFKEFVFCAPSLWQVGVEALSKCSLSMVCLLSFCFATRFLHAVTSCQSICIN